MEELIFEFLFQFLLIVPGAFIRWMAGGFKKPFRDYMNNVETNIYIGLAVLSALFLLIFFLTL